MSMQIVDVNVANDGQGLILAAYSQKDARLLVRAGPGERSGGHGGRQLPERPPPVCPSRRRPCSRRWAAVLMANAGVYYAKKTSANSTVCQRQLGGRPGHRYHPPRVQLGQQLRLARRRRLRHAAPSSQAVRTVAPAPAGATVASGGLHGARPVRPIAGRADAYSGPASCLRPTRCSRRVRSSAKVRDQRGPGVGRVDHVVDEARARPPPTA